MFAEDCESSPIIPPGVMATKLSLCAELNQRGQVKETKREALRELVTVKATKDNKAEALYELRGRADSKEKKSGAMQELLDREKTKENKSSTLSELVKVLYYLFTNLHILFCYPSQNIIHIYFENTY